MKFIYKIANSMKVNKVDLAKMMASMNGSYQDYMELVKLDMK